MNHHYSFQRITMIAIAASLAILLTISSFASASADVASAVHTTGNATLGDAARAINTAATSELSLSSPVLASSPVAATAADAPSHHTSIIYNVLSEAQSTRPLYLAALARAERQRKLNTKPTLFQHVEMEHKSGNAQPKFTVTLVSSTSMDDGPTATPEEIQIHVKEISPNQSAITPSTLYSLFGRMEREVGDLGHSFLVQDRDHHSDLESLNSNEYALGDEKKKVVEQASFAFLVLDWNTFQIRGVAIVNGKVIRVDESSVRVPKYDNHAEAPNTIEVKEEELATNNNNDSSNIPSRRGLTIAEEQLPTPPSYLYQVNLFLEIDHSFVEQIAGLTTSSSSLSTQTTLQFNTPPPPNPTCLTHAYINTLVTAANSILEEEVKAHLNVVYINQTMLYDDYDGNEYDLNTVEGVLEKMKSVYVGRRNSNHNDNEGEDAVEVAEGVDMNEGMGEGERKVQETMQEWHYDGIDLHYAMLGKELKGGDENTNNNGEDIGTVCDPQRGFGVIGNMKGDFNSLDERWLLDLKELVMQIG